ncbi:MAG: efflux RND transporter periplasmic adaptor subunit [Enhygromyxa sp.]
MKRWIGVALLLAACTERGDEQLDVHEDDHAEQARSLTSAWVEVTRPRDASLLELPARIVAAADTRARLDAPLRGSVVALHVQIGDRVEAGAELIELRIPELLEAAATLAGAREQLGAHQARRDRLEELKRQGLVGASELFSVESGIGKLSAERRLALATLTAAGIDERGRRELLARGTLILEAPIPGVVAELDVIPGEVVEPGESLAQILGQGSARVEVAFSGALPSDVSLEFVGLGEERFALAPTPISTAIEPGLGRTLAWYEPAEERALAHGVRGRVVLRGTDTELLEVPRRALRLHEGQAWVGRRPVHGGEAELVAVEVLRSVGSSALVRSAELKVGDRVAADAATVLQLGREPGELGGHDH